MMLKDKVAVVYGAGGAIDALDEPDVTRNLQYVMDRAGRVDISFNAISVRDTKILGVPLAELGAGGSWRSRRWLTWRPSWLPIRRAG